MSTTMTNLRPGYERGKCHVCENTMEIHFCKLCGHWLCDMCSWRLVHRAIAAITQLKEKMSLGPKTLGCCGPTPPEQEEVAA